MNEPEVLYAENTAEWRSWLEKHHESQSSVWLVFHTKKSGRRSLTWSESVDVALCFGWIDSKKIKINEDTSHQFFSKRKAKSTWSKINKEKTERLTQAGLMTPAGLKSVETAKENGSWTVLDQVEELVIPEDLENAFMQMKGSKEYFLGLSKSARKMQLQHVTLAKRPETRARRIAEIINGIAAHL